MFQQEDEEAVQFLFRFPERYRSAVANLFYRAQREDCQGEEQLLQWVWDYAAEKRALLAGNDERRKLLGDLLLAAHDARRNDPEAQDVRLFCTYVRSGARVPPGQEQRQHTVAHVGSGRAAQQEHGRASATEYVGNGLPTQHSHAGATRPTDKQLALLHELGYDGPEPQTRGEASDLIRQIREGQQRRYHERTLDTSGTTTALPVAPMTEKQFILLKQLGYSGKPPQTKQEASRRIEQLLADKKSRCSQQGEQQTPDPRRTSAQPPFGPDDIDGREVRI